MRALTWADFAGAEGGVYRVDSGEAELALTLEVASELPPSGRAEGSFRLEFLGPEEPLLEQAIYPLRRGEDLFDIFIVPIGRDSRGTRYEAVFY